MSRDHHPVFERLRADTANGPLVVAHRGDSLHHAENTLAAFAAARRLGVAMQEFDVRATRDGVLCCIHDETFDRTTDVRTVLGPGALVAEATWAEVTRLDAGLWHGPAGAEKVPSLHDALLQMLPDCVPLIEHKAGAATDYVATLRTVQALDRCIAQSFDWQFVAEIAAIAPDLATAVLGPTSEHVRLDATAITRAREIGAGMVHWQASELTGEAVTAAHAAGLMVCSYTTDDELGWRGGAAMGIDAMCTNNPASMLALRLRGVLARRR